KATSFNHDIGAWDISKVTDMSGMFYNATAFNGNIGNWDTAAVTNMYAMFYKATSFNHDIGAWDISKVTNMSGMFQNATAFNGDIGSWGTAAVTNMSLMFADATSFNQDIGNWKTSNVTDMSYIFSGATVFNGDIGNWDTAAVNNMYAMFPGATSFNQNLSGWCVTSITTEPDYFSSNPTLTEANKPVWGSCPAKDPTTQTTLSFTERLNSVGFKLLDLDMPDIIDIFWFYDDKVYGTVFLKNFYEEVGWSEGSCESVSEGTQINSDGERVEVKILENTVDKLLIEVSYDDEKGTVEFISDDLWDISKDDNDQFVSSISVTRAEYGDVGSAETYERITLGSENWCDLGTLSDTIHPSITLIGAPSINLNLGDTFTDPGATASDDVDGDLTSSLSISDSVDTSTAGTYVITYSVTDTAGNTTTLTRTIVVSEPTSDNIYFENGICKCPQATVGETSFINGKTYTAVDDSTIRLLLLPTGMGGVEELNLCTTLVTDMSQLFILTFFNGYIGNWDTSNVIDMSNMFQNATQFNQDIGNWDTSNVIDMSYIFRDATSFNQDIGNWKTSNVTDMSGMFQKTIYFNQDIGNWDTSSVTVMNYMFDNATQFNQDIGNWDISKVTSVYAMFSGATSFNQNLSGWCVKNITNEPPVFNQYSALTDADKPVWGTCPSD
ncbi:MAG: BspA family leucine-rich repeat surface protein, partial [Methylophagaceae bacterium]